MPTLATGARRSKRRLSFGVRRSAHTDILMVRNSVRTTRQSSAQRGFSLLEILVVLVVIVIITATVTVSVNSGGEDQLLESQVRGLADAAEFALDEAQMAGLNYGLLFEETSEAGIPFVAIYWYQRNLDGWSELTEQEVFSRSALPPSITVELDLADSPLAEAELEQTGEDGEENRILPQIMFYSSGEMTEGALNIRRREDSELLWRIEWDLLGRFKVLLKGEPELEAF
ncbi:MAG: prepilin-type N-terminal cleavage/methylation domain-containing protein [Halioglobus sp.]